MVDQSLWSSSRLETAKSMWHPIAASDDLPYRHVFDGQLLGNELAVWRADDGNVNVWENRCLHRGVRLSIGANEGSELKCRYHGWRYANRTASCTYIPAHPADSPARTICGRTYEVVEKYGLVWSRVSEDVSEAPSLPELEALETGDFEVLKPVPINGPIDLVIAELGQYPVLSPNQSDEAHADISSESLGDFALVRKIGSGKAAAQVIFVAQPVDANRTVLRGLVTLKPDEADRVSILRHYNDQLSILRDLVETEAARHPAIERIQPVKKADPQAGLSFDHPNEEGRKSDLTVSVRKKWPVGEGVVAFELKPLSGALPSFQPGAHIDVHMPNGEIRQYSLTNGPAETTNFVIAVKLEPESKGGSACMHNVVSEGDVLAISLPRNNFPLRRDGTKTIFIAGGIGITPLLSMAKTLKSSVLPFEFHCFAQSADHVAFREMVGKLDPDSPINVGLSPEETGERMNEILSSYKSSMQFYVCGPGPMLEAARKTASNAGWPEEAIHFEYFKNSNPVDDGSSFEIALARSGKTLRVEAGKSIVEVLRENGIYIPSSCEQGACGTCVTDVLDGEPDHQDVFLRESDRKNGNKMMICVSRALSDRLVLDL